MISHGSFVSYKTLIGPFIFLSLSISCYKTIIVSDVLTIHHGLTLKERQTLTTSEGNHGVDRKTRKRPALRKVPRRPLPRRRRPFTIIPYNNHIYFRSPDLTPLTGIHTSRVDVQNPSPTLPTLDPFLGPRRSEITVPITGVGVLLVELFPRVTHLHLAPKRDQVSMVI